MKSSITTENGVSLVLSTRPVASVKMLYEGSAPKTLKPTQLDCAITLLPAVCASLDAPTGSGKSVSIMVLTDLRLRRNSNRLALICVPQTQIADNFTALTYKWEGTTHSLTTRKFCGDGNDVVKVERVAEVLKWLRREHATYSSDRCAVISHQGLVRLWAKLTGEERSEVFKYVDLYIDEAHHVEGALSDTDSNCLGRIVKAGVARETFASVLLATATMFRGDVTPLLSQAELATFTRWQLPWEANFEEMNWLRHFDMNYVFGDNWQETISHIITSARKKDIVYLPAANSSLSNIVGGKYAGVQNVLETYRIMLGKEATITYTDEGVHLLRSANGKRSLRVLDLVTETDRVKKKTYFNRMRAATNTEPKRGRDMLDVVVTLNMMKEGADWIWAERIVLMGKRDSFVDQLQILGRLLRDAPGKTHVELVNVLMRPYNENDLHAKVNHQVNNILRAMILETIIAPVYLTLAGVGRYSGKKRNWLIEAVPCADHRMKVLEQACDWFATANVDNEDSKVLESQFCREVNSILGKVNGNNLDSDLTSGVARTIMRMLITPVAKDKLSDDIDLVTMVEGPNFTSLAARCGLQTLRQLREFLCHSKGCYSATYNECLAFNKLHKLSSREWSRAFKEGTLPYGFPPLPDYTFRECFDSLEFWSSRPPAKIKVSYEECVTYQKSVQHSRASWTLAGRKGQLPQGFPVYPDRCYKHQFDSKSFWNQAKTTKCVSYEDCLLYNSVAQIGSLTAWEVAYVKGSLPKDFPRFIRKVKGFDHDKFFGTAKKVKRITATYAECILFNKRNKIKHSDWREALTTGKVPGHFPTDPASYFKGVFVTSDFWPKVYLTPAEKEALYKRCVQYNAQHKVTFMIWRSMCLDKTLPEGFPSMPKSYFRDIYEPKKFWSPRRKCLASTSKSVVEKPSEGRFEVKRYSTSSDAVRQQAA